LLQLQSTTSGKIEVEDLNHQPDPDRIQQLEATIQDLSDQLQEQAIQATEVVAMWQQSYADIEQKLNAAIKEHATKGQDSSEEFQKMTEMERTIVDLKLELESSVAEADDVVAAWQDSYGELEKQYSDVAQEKEQLVMDLLNTKNELERLRQEHASCEAVTTNESLASNESRSNVSFKKIVKSLDKQLSEVVLDAEEAVDTWKTRCRELETQLDSLMKRPTDPSIESISSKDLNVASDSMHDRIEQLKCTIHGLEEQKQNDSFVAAQLKEQTVSLEERLNEMTNEYHIRSREVKNILQRLYRPIYSSFVKVSGNEAVDDNVSTSENEIDPKLIEDFQEINLLLQERFDILEECIGAVVDDQDSKNKLREEQFTSLERSLHSLREHSLQDAASYKESECNHARVVVDFKDRVQALVNENEEMLTSLKESQESMLSLRQEAHDRLQELEAQITERNQSIELWKAKSEELDNKLLEITSENSILKDELQAAVSQQSDLSISKTVENVSELREEIKNLEIQLADLTQDAEEVVFMWQDRCKQLELQVEALLEEKSTIGDSKTSEIRKSEESSEQVNETSTTTDELKVQNDVVQLHANVEAQQILDNEDLKSVLEQWQASYAALETELKVELSKNQEYLNELNSTKEIIRLLYQYTSTIVSVDHKEENLDIDEVGSIEILGRLRTFFDALIEQTKCARDDKSLNDSQGVPSSHAHVENDQLTRLEVMVQSLQEQLSSSNKETDYMKQNLTDRIKSLMEENVRISSELAAKQAFIDTLQHPQTISGTNPTQERDSELEVEASTKATSNLSYGAPTVERETLPIADTHAELHNLQDQISRLEDQLTDQALQAEDVVGQWQRSHEMLLLEIEALNIANEDLQVTLSEFQASETLNIRSSEKLSEDFHDDSETTIETRQLEDLSAQTSKLSQENESLKEKVKMLESRVSSHMETAFRLEQEMDIAREEKRTLQDAIEQLQAEKRSLEVIAREAEREKSARASVENRCASLEKKLAETENLFISRLETVSSEKDRKIEQLENTNMNSAETAKSLEGDVITLRSDISTLEHENDTLEYQVAELSRELREANTAMQMFITNGVSEKASKSAADALRLQLVELGSQLEKCKELLAIEREKRERLEKDNELLSIDIAGLVGMENSETNKSKIQLSAMEATETLHRRERVEIETLRGALSRAMDELNAARTMQKTLEDNVSKVSHQAVVYEQQVLNSKTEFLFLTETMDEMRDSESTRRASFEYRIDSLETEVQVQRLRYVSEIENLKNELSQVSMEKDRLLQSLQESEKRRESLMNSATRVVVDDDASGQCLRKVQLEKTFLLSSCGEEASRLERRLREAQVAQKSALEADIMLERELRFAAESLLENMTKEMNDIQKDISNASKFESYADKSDSGEILEQLKKDLQQATEQLQIRSKENLVLRERLETTMKESQASIERLQLETQQAKARVIHFERAGHFEAEVRVEQARLEASYGNGTQNLSLRDSFSEEKKDDAVVTKLYDFIKKQTLAIEEERSVYMELATKNDELLELLAQLDVLRNSLKAAVIEHGGHQVLEEAFRNAEEKVRVDFGRNIKFN
jgi:hypothetical protein